MKDKILTVDYSSNTFATWALFLQYTDFESVVFICADADSDWLDAQCDVLNESQQVYQWLWSHPDQGGHSTPVPVLIQQERAQLEGLRKKTGYYNNEAD